MGTKQFVLGAVAAAATAIAFGAAAAPTQWTIGSGGNDHYYDFVATPLSAWETVQPLADATSYLGLQGYLATITSGAEDAFIHSVITSASGGNPVTWVDGSDAAAEGVWRWTGGPEAGIQFWQGGVGGFPVGGAYTNWNGGEPNNADGAENYIELNWYGSSGWNDAGPSTYYYPTLANGYVVEYGGLSATPEPASWALMILGFGGVGAALRNRRKVFAAI